MLGQSFSTFHSVIAKAAENNYISVRKKQINGHSCLLENFKLVKGFPLQERGMKVVVVQPKTPAQVPFIHQNVSSVLVQRLFNTFHS